MGAGSTARGMCIYFKRVSGNKFKDPSWGETITRADYGHPKVMLGGGSFKLRLICG